MTTKNGDEPKITDTTRFLVRGLNLLRDDLLKYGFVNAFLDDNDHEHHYQDSLYLLFKPEEISEFEWFVESEKLRTHLFIDEYDYPKGYIVLVYKFPSEYMQEYRAFKKGEYSKFSNNYKELFPTIKEGNTKRGIPYKTPSFYQHIFTKSKKMREYWEGVLDVELDVNSELWNIPNPITETLNIKNYE